MIFRQQVVQRVRFCRQELKSIERLERAPQRNLSAGAQGGDEPGERSEKIDVVVMVVMCNQLLYLY